MRFFNKRKKAASVSGITWLRIGIGGRTTTRFRLEYAEGEELHVSMIPTTTQDRKEGVFWARPKVETWRVLNDLVESGIAEVDDEAEDEMERLRAEHVAHRISVRRAEAQWKARANKPVELPMKTRPYDHQARAAGFGYAIPCPAILAEQGTGKTFVGLAVSGKRHLDGDVKRLLVITTASAVHVWGKQAEEHCGFVTTVEEWESKGRCEYPSGPGLHIISCSYDLAVSREKQLAKWKPDMIILDESQKIQSRRSDRARTCHRLGDKSKYRMIATGTPIGQNPFTAWAQFRFLDADLFGRAYGPFRDRYAEMGGYMNLEVKGFKNLEEFSRKIHSISFRTTKAECLDLPPETQQDLFCYPDAKTLRIYRELDLEFLTEIGDRTISVDRRVSAIAKLRQITGGLLKDEDRIIPVSQVKIKTLRDHLESIHRKKIVIFTVFNHEMEMVLDLCKKLKRKALSFHGKTKNRGDVVSTFQSSKLIDTIVVQVQTGDAGIDLFAATESIFYSPTFSFLNYSQAKSRIHRIGQEESVTHTRLLMKGTVDEHVALILQSSGDLSSLILDGNRNYRLQRSNIR